MDILLGEGFVEVHRDHDVGQIRHRYGRIVVERVDKHAPKRKGRPFANIVQVRIGIGLVKLLNPGIALLQDKEILSRVPSKEKELILGNFPKTSCLGQLVKLLNGKLAKGWLVSQKIILLLANHHSSSTLLFHIIISYFHRKENGYQLSQA